MTTEARQLTRLLTRKVFPALRRRGITARANFVCCQPCANSRLMKIAHQQGTRGGVYWHGQDRDALRDGEIPGLYIGYVASPKPREPRERRYRRMEEIARDLVAAARRYGLRTEWDRRSATRVLVRLKKNRRRS